jgi:hypothetical protein
VKPLLRRFLTTSAIVLAAIVLVASWFVLTMTSCDYQRVYQRPSPTTRYVAELWGADCGMGAYFGLVLVRDQSALSLPRLDGRPPGADVTWYFDSTDARADIFWVEETTLVIQHSGAEAPELVRTEWGGVRIVARQAPHQP